MPIIDGLNCNENGFPIETEYGLLLGAVSGSGATGIGQGVDESNTWATPITNKVLPALNTRVPAPISFFACNSPGPAWQTSVGARLYEFDSFLWARDSDGPTHRYTPPEGVSADNTDRSGIASTLALFSTQVARPFNLRWVQYSGRLDTPALLALATSDPTACDARLEAAYQLFRTAGVDVLCIDATSPIGGYSKASDLSNDSSVFAVAVKRWIDRKKADASAPLIVVEAWPETATNSSNPRLSNRIFGPGANGTRGCPVYNNYSTATGGNDPNFGAASWQAPAADHDSFIAGNSGEFVSTAPQLFRNIVNAGGVPLIGQDQYAAVAPLLPPRWQGGSVDQSAIPTRLVSPIAARGVGGLAGGFGRL